MIAQLDILDVYRQQLVKTALEKNTVPDLDTAILEVERYSKKLTPDAIDKAINFAEILLELEAAKWKLENPLVNNQH